MDLGLTIRLTHPVWLVAGMIYNPLDVENLLQLKGISNNLDSAVKFATDYLEVTRLSQGEYRIPCAVGTSFSRLKKSFFKASQYFAKFKYVDCNLITHFDTTGIVFRRSAAAGLEYIASHPILADVVTVSSADQDKRVPRAVHSGAREECHPTSVAAPEPPGSQGAQPRVVLGSSNRE